ncbi:MAG: (E)-4-hydroxy-3-methylbut-2-enyl-diphosphate synthase [Myxococcota bacterium]
MTEARKPDGDPPLFLAPVDLYRPGRRRTRVVRVGNVGIGGDEPIRIQSMTNTDTMDTAGTVEQVTRLAEAGCEIVRVTAPSIRDAENLREIRRQLLDRRIDVPLVADIHFTPNAAMIAAEVVEKVRINPGNYADKKKFEVREYDDAEYEAEIERVGNRFRPLVMRCKENGVAMRIGTNHGSLSDRILNRYGDTAEGMVESAIEFLEVCEAEDYYDVVFSMKASNTQVAIQAYRLLAARLEARAPGELSYPFHVGVTEAGDAEDGRIKSAIGIGSLLEDGLGDTIRVSLTEDPVREVPVARGIAHRAAAVAATRATKTTPIEVEAAPFVDFFSNRRRTTQAQTWAGLSLGDEAPLRVELEVPDGLLAPADTAARLAMDLSALRDVECESLLVTAQPNAEGLGATAASAKEAAAELARELGSVGLEMPISVRVGSDQSELLAEPGPASELAESAARCVLAVDGKVDAAALSLIRESAQKARLALEFELHGEDHEIPELVRRALGTTDGGRGGSLDMISVSLAPTASVHAHRVLVAALSDANAASVPLVLRGLIAKEADGERGARREGSEGQGAASIPVSASGELLVVAGAGGAVPEAALIDASVRLGSLLCDGIGDAISFASEVGAAPAIDLAYRVLQGARQRTTRTEYISCPSCGRTLFDLEETTARIKARTDHLKGVKIAVMGCIVNGPGEMADADFGYVGSGVGQVTLYVGQEIVARAVPEAEATDRLVDLIRDHGEWVDRA